MQDDGSGGAPRPASVEGPRQRCFRRLLFCGRQRWHEAYPLTAFGRLLLRHHGFPPPPPPPSLPQPAAGAGAGGGQVPAGGGAAAAAAAAAQPLRVLFQHRNGSTRQLLNVQELVAACNAWRFQPPGAAAALSASCAPVALGSLRSTLEAAQEADVLVGMHGANLVRGRLHRCEEGRKGGTAGHVCTCSHLTHVPAARPAPPALQMGGFLMRPGGIVVEFWNYQFSQGHTAFLAAAQQVGVACSSLAAGDVQPAVLGACCAVLPAPGVPFIPCCSPTAS